MIALNPTTACDNRTLLCGFTEEQLDAAFKLVADQEDWRARVLGWVSMSDLPAVLVAVQFFTATEARITATRTDSTFWIEADGYRAGPAGP